MSGGCFRLWRLRCQMAWLCLLCGREKHACTQILPRIRRDGADIIVTEPALYLLGAIPASGSAAGRNGHAAPARRRPPAWQGWSDRIDAKRARNSHEITHCPNMDFCPAAAEEPVRVPARRTTGPRHVHCTPWRQCSCLPPTAPRCLGGSAGAASAAALRKPRRTPPTPPVGQDRTRLRGTGDAEPRRAEPVRRPL